MNDVIKRACAALEIDPGQVLSYRIDDELGQVSIVADMGIKGCPKLTIALSDISKPEPVAKPEPAKEAPKPKRTRKKKAN